MEIYQKETGAVHVGLWSTTSTSTGLMLVYLLFVTSDNCRYFSNLGYWCAVLLGGVLSYNYIMLNTILILILSHSLLLSIRPIVSGSVSMFVLLSVSVCHRVSMSVCERVSMSPLLLSVCERVSVSESGQLTSVLVSTSVNFVLFIPGISMDMCLVCLHPGTTALLCQPNRASL